MQTLILSNGYEPLARVHWQRAITLLFLGKVEVVEEYADRQIRTVTFALQMPSVVRFLRAIRGIKAGVKFSRQNVYTRDGGRCQYCGRALPRHEATYDHVVPRAQGGRTVWENIVIACIACNQRKGCRTPQQAGLMLRQKPVKPVKLPGAARFTLTYQPGMPESWKNWIRDYGYWNTELESDQE